MKCLMQQLRSDFKRACISANFLLAILSTVLILLLSASLGLIHAYSLYYISTLTNMSFTILSYIICTFPYATSFCVDWNTKYYRFICIRTGPTIYSISKVIASTVSGGLAVTLGYALFYIALGLKYPLANSADMINIHAQHGFSTLIYPNPLLYFIAQLILHFCKAAFFCAIALFVSTYFINVFVVSFSPVLAFYFFSILINIFHPPVWINFRIIYDSGAFQQPLHSIIYMIIFTLGVCVAINILIRNKIARRLQDA